MKIIVGLGNPGKKYDNTPHNVGFSLVDKLAESSVWKKDKKSLTQRTIISGMPVLLAKPTTYMNLSGDAVQALSSFYKIPVSDLVVVVDDASLNLGAIRIRIKGSHGGHNGLKSIIQHFGINFVRIKIGVGICPTGRDLSDHVLKRLNKNELVEITELGTFFAEIIEYGLKYGWEKAASKYNRSTIS
jgi:PTH1 family peptidyl-tRNA hydrolase